MVPAGCAATVADAIAIIAMVSPAHNTPATDVCPNTRRTFVTPTHDHVAVVRRGEDLVNRR
jgi:hypothetical protein